MTLIALIGMTFGFLLVFTKWRACGAACLAIGFLQDPLRKLIPGQPVVITVMVAGFFLLMLLRGLMKQQGLKLSSLFPGQKYLRLCIQLFIGLVAVQALFTFLKTSSITAPIAGLLAYLSPLAAIWVGFFYFKHLKGFDRLVALYVGFVVLATVGVMLSYAGFDWAILDSVGGDLLITAPYVEGGILIPHAGFMRTAEIAAWHLATGVQAVLYMTILRTDNSRWPIFSLGLVPFFLAGVILTGRRKTIAGIMIFILTYILISLLLNNQRGLKKVFAGLGLIALIGMVIQATVNLGAFTDYLLRYQTLGNTVEIQDRITVLGFETIVWAVQTVGFWGAGAGMVSQGAQQVVSGAGEGGLGKIVFELGIPGLVLVVYMLGAFGKYIFLLFKQLRYWAPQQASLFMGLVAFVVANLGTYVVAAQVYGDPFVLIILGTCLGFTLSAPRIVATAPTSPTWVGNEKGYVSP